MLNSKEEFEKINERLKSLTPEQIKRTVLCLNRKITKEIVETVLSETNNAKFLTRIKRRIE